MLGNLFLQNWPKVSITFNRKFPFFYGYFSPYFTSLSLAS